MNAAFVFPPPEEDWEPVQKVSEKPQGIVWLVRRPLPAGWRWGYFKYAGPEHRYYAGPMVANEWLAACLLRLLDLPAAPVVPARLGRYEGIVSVVQTAHPRPRRWRDLPLSVRRRHMRTFHRPLGLYGMIAFDIWTTNIDRGTGKNIVVYRRRPRGRYRYYLIDHALALHGSYYKWDHYGPWPGPAWSRPWRVYAVPRGLVPTRRRLLPWVERIARLPRDTLTALVRAVPEHHLTEGEADFILRLLLTRREQLPGLIERWLRRRAG